MLIVGDNDFQFQAGMSVASKPFVPSNVSNNSKPSVSNDTKKAQAP